MTRPKWLVIVPAIPRFDHAGGDRRLIEILDVVGRSCDILMLVTEPRRVDDAAYEQALSERGIRLVGFGRRAGVRALLKHSFSVVFFEFYLTTFTFLRVARSLHPRAVIMVDSVDLAYMREREAARLGQLSPDASLETEKLELAAYRSADITIAVSNTEQATLRGNSITDVSVIPIIVPIASRTHKTRRPSVLFVGGFNHAPNKMAVEWFHQAIWPTIRSRVPDAVWTIAGSMTPANIRELHGKDGIEVLGHVASTAPLLDDAQISIAPLTFGAGMKSKVCEALGAGIPVVTTSWGAQGLEDGIGTAFRVADDPQLFAEEVVHLLRDSTARELLSLRGQEFASHICSKASAEPEIERLVKRSTEVRGSFADVPKRVLSLGTLVLKKKIARSQTNGPIANPA